MSRVLPGRQPPATPDFYTKWGEENAKEFSKTATAALGQLLTINAALLAGSVALWKDTPFPKGVHLLVIALLLCSTLICLFSVIPLRGRYELGNATDIRTYMESVTCRKQRCLRIVVSLLTLELVVMVLGVFWTALT